jgi:release factor glutamine methyltransferase
VVAIDINPEAVRYAQENADRNGCQSKMTVLHGDLFEPLPPDTRFDVILFNPPFWEGVLKNNFSHALFDPGKVVIRRFLKEGKQYLKPGGNMQVLYSSTAALESLLKIAEEYRWNHSIIAGKKVITEYFCIYKFTPKNEKKAVQRLTDRIK